MPHLRLISRESFLAMAQTMQVMQYLQKQGVQVSVSTALTTGDQFLETPLYQTPFSHKNNKALFTKELEERLLQGQADIAVHSLKDLPTELPTGLVLAGTLFSHSQEDILITKEKLQHLTLQPPKTIATSSIRRMALLKSASPHFNTIPIRGNLVTRLKKFLHGEIDCDALILAKAGLERLWAFYQLWPKLQNSKILQQLSAKLLFKLHQDYEDLHILWRQKFFLYALQPTEFIPQAAQGVLGIESPSLLQKKVQALLPTPKLNPKSILERKLLATLEVGCHIPFGVYAEKLQEPKAIYKLHAFYAPHFAENSKKTGLSFCRYLPQKNYELFLAFFAKELRQEKLPVVFTGRNFSGFARYFSPDYPLYSLPLTQSVPTQEKLPAQRFDAVAFASFTAYQYFAQHAPLELKKLPYYVVGPSSRLKILQQEPLAQIYAPPKDFHSIGLANLLLASPHQRILWVGAQKGITEGIELLKAQGKSVFVFTPYHNQAFPKTEILKQAQQIFKHIPQEARFVFTSPKAVEVFYELSLPLPFQPFYFALGRSSAKKLQELGFWVYGQAEKSELSSLAACLLGKLPTTFSVTPFALDALRSQNAR